MRRSRNRTTPAKQPSVKQPLSPKPNVGQPARVTQRNTQRRGDFNSTLNKMAADFREQGKKNKQRIEGLRATKVADAPRRPQVPIVGQPIPSVGQPRPIVGQPAGTTQRKRRRTSGGTRKPPQAINVTNELQRRSRNLEQNIYKELGYSSGKEFAKAQQDLYERGDLAGLEALNQQFQKVARPLNDRFQRDNRALIDRQRNIDRIRRQKEIDAAGGIDALRRQQELDFQRNRQRAAQEQFIKQIMNARGITPAFKQQLIQQRLNQTPTLSPQQRLLNEARQRQRQQDFTRRPRRKRRLTNAQIQQIMRRRAELRLQQQRDLLRNSRNAFRRMGARL